MSAEAHLKEINNELVSELIEAAKEVEAYAEQECQSLYVHGQHDEEFNREHESALAAINRLRTAIEKLEPTQKFQITVSRTSARATDFFIEAKNKKEAEQKAIEQAHNHDFTQHQELDSVEYEIESIEEEHWPGEFDNVSACAGDNHKQEIDN